MSLSLQTISFERVNHANISLADYAGSVVLVVNVASRCGLTKQYEGLQKLYQNYHPQELDILAFPCNQFAGQEPGTDEEILQFCSTEYQVDFPVMKKIEVNGANAHPLYQALKAAVPDAVQGDGTLRQKLQEKGLLGNNPGDIMWNFEKFLIGRDGQVIGRYAPDITPDNPQLIADIEKALKA